MPGSKCSALVSFWAINHLKSMTVHLNVLHVLQKRKNYYTYIIFFFFSNFLLLFFKLYCVVIPATFKHVLSLDPMKHYEALSRIFSCSGICCRCRFVQETFCFFQICKKFTCCHLCQELFPWLFTLFVLIWFSIMKNVL